MISVRPWTAEDETAAAGGAARSAGEERCDGGALTFREHLLLAAQETRARSRLGALRRLEKRAQALAQEKRAVAKRIDAAETQHIREVKAVNRLLDREGGKQALLM